MAYLIPKISSLSLGLPTFFSSGSIDSLMSDGAARSIQGLGALTAGYFAWQTVSTLAGKAHQWYSERDGAWIPGELQGKLTHAEIVKGNILFSNLNAINSEIKALEEAPIKWYKIAIAVLLVLLACLAMFFGHLTIAGTINSAPILLTMFSNTIFTDDPKLKILEKKRDEAKKTLDDFIVELLEKPRDAARAPSKSENVDPIPPTINADDLVEGFEEEKRKDRAQEHEKVWSEAVSGKAERPSSENQPPKDNSCGEIAWVKEFDDSQNETMTYLPGAPVSQISPASVSASFVDQSSNASKTDQSVGQIWENEFATKTADSTISKEAQKFVAEFESEQNSSLRSNPNSPANQKSAASFARFQELRKAKMLETANRRGGGISSHLTPTPGTKFTTPKTLRARL